MSDILLNALMNFGSKNMVKLGLSPLKLVLFVLFLLISEMKFCSIRVRHRDLCLVLIIFIRFYII